MKGCLPSGEPASKSFADSRRRGTPPRDRRRRTGPLGPHERRDAADVALKVLRVMGYTHAEIHRAVADLSSSYFTIRRRCMAVDRMTLDFDADAFLDDARSA